VKETKKKKIKKKLFFYTDTLQKTNNPKMSKRALVILSVTVTLLFISSITLLILFIDQSQIPPLETAIPILSKPVESIIPTPSKPVVSNVTVVSYPPLIVGQTNTVLPTVYPSLYGLPPFTFKANDLPYGVKVDPINGAIYGVPSRQFDKKTYTIEVSNSTGTQKTELDMIITNPTFNYRVYSLGKVTKLIGGQVASTSSTTLQLKDDKIPSTKCIFSFSIGVHLGSFSTDDNRQWFSKDRSIIGLGGDSPTQSDKCLQCFYAPARTDKAQNILQGLVQHYNKQQVVDNQFALNSPSLLVVDDSKNDQIKIENPPTWSGGVGTKQAHDLAIYAVELVDVDQSKVPNMVISSGSYIGVTNRDVNSVNVTTFQSYVYISNER
jgi:hypothetical protein